MGSDSHRTQWGYNQGADNLCTTHQQVLQTHGRTNLYGILHHIGLWLERTRPAHQRQHVRPHKQEIHHETGCDEFSQTRAEGCTHDTHT